MLFRRSIAAACLFAIAAGSASAEPSSSPRKPTPPTTVAGKTLDSWIKDLERSDPGQRETAIRAIPYFQENATKAVPTLLEVLSNSRDIPCRVQACLSLSYIAPHMDAAHAAKTVKLLIDKADADTQAIVRLHAVIALGAFGDQAVSATTVLGRRVHDPISWELRQAALFSLASVARGPKRVGPEKEAIMPVVRLLNPPLGTNPERSSLVRLAAVQTLRYLGVPRDMDAYHAAVEALEKATHDHDLSVAIWAHVTMITFDKSGSEVRLNTVTGRLTDKDIPAKLTAAEALGAALKSLDDDTVVKVRVKDIINLLDDKEPIVQAAAIDVLAGLRGRAGDAVPRLKEIMEKKDQNEYFRQACQDALKEITGKKPELAPRAPKNDSSQTSTAANNKPPEAIEGKTLDQWIKEIKETKDHNDPSVQETAIRVVPFFGEKAARKAGPALISRLTSQNIDIACRAHAILALGALAEDMPKDDATKAVEAIAGVVRDSNQTILRYHAATALGSFGVKATEAIPTLINLMHEGNSWEARQAAVLSLSNIAGGDENKGPDSRAVRAISERILGQQEASAQVRMTLVMALGIMGRPRNMDVQIAGSALRQGMQDSNKSVQIWATVALMAVDKVSDKGLDLLCNHFKGKDVSAKVTASPGAGRDGQRVQTARR